MGERIKIRFSTEEEEKELSGEYSVRVEWPGWGSERYFGPGYLRPPRDEKGREGRGLEGKIELVVPRDLKKGERIHIRLYFPEP